ncbi:MAG: glycosyltransferase [Bacteroidales bacterium]|nr:glycosyltransferase [Bacteroidales bacterium]
MKVSVAHIRNGEYNLTKSEELKKVVTQLTADYVFIYLSPTSIEWGKYAEERMLQVIMDTGAGMVYSDYYKMKDGYRKACPVLDYQEGSLREDFDFGPVVLYKTSVLKRAVSRIKIEYIYASLYALRLKVSQIAKIIHINEYLYTEPEQDSSLPNEKKSESGNIRKREIEMETACTAHLKDISARLDSVYESVNFHDTSFPVEASVIVSVKNGEKNIEEALRSVWMQETDFSYNIIVVDNHSTDSTASIIKKWSMEDERLIYILPDRKDLKTGGCRNEAIMSPHCGKFAIQLNSDCVYTDSQVLSKIVKSFYKQKTPMIIGIDRMDDFHSENLSPKRSNIVKWTLENGRNNILRMNEPGTPYAFFTPILRSIKFPDTDDGENYAVALAIARNYQIGRIYEPLHLRQRCENSYTEPGLCKLNICNHYKDSLRSQELLARKRIIVKPEPDMWED